MHFVQSAAVINKNIARMVNWWSQLAYHKL